jgi:hypothetical protein
MLTGETMINGELVVDNFAGGGGASTGIEMATGVSVDIAVMIQKLSECIELTIQLQNIIVRTFGR